MADAQVSSAIANWGAFRQHRELGLVHVEVALFASHVDEFPQLGGGLIAGGEGKADVDERGIERRDVLEGAGDRIAMRIDLFIAEPESVGVG